MVREIAISHTVARRFEQTIQTTILPHAKIVTDEREIRGALRGAQRRDDKMADIEHHTKH